MGLLAAEAIRKDLPDVSVKVSPGSGYGVWMVAPWNALLPLEMSTAVSLEPAFDDPQAAASERAATRATSRASRLIVSAPPARPPPARPPGRRRPSRRLMRPARRA